MQLSDVAANFISQFHSWKSESDFIVSLHAEGNEGDMFWKWFDMQVYIIPGSLLIKKKNR